jgi:acid phosphatase family membrane protein YuiD
VQDGPEKIAGTSAAVFDEMTRQTIVRKIERFNTEQLLDLLGHLIIQERLGR